MKASSNEADWGESSCRTTRLAPARSPMALRQAHHRQTAVIVAVDGGPRS